MLFRLSYVSLIRGCFIAGFECMSFNTKSNFLKSSTSHRLPKLPCLLCVPIIITFHIPQLLSSLPQNYHSILRSLPQLLSSSQHFHFHSDARCAKISFTYFCCISFPIPSLLQLDELRSSKATNADEKSRGKADPRV